jgi:Domain of unknown function (DUF1902)
MSIHMGLEHRTINIQMLRHKETGLLIALSDEMKGLYVHARTMDDLLDRIPVAIRDILEADGFEVLDVSEIGPPPEAEAGFLPALRKFEASLGSKEAA